MRKSMALSRKSRVLFTNLVTTIVMATFTSSLAVADVKYLKSRISEINKDINDTKKQITANDRMARELEDGDHDGDDPKYAGRCDTCKPGVSLGCTTADFEKANLTEADYVG